MADWDRMFRVNTTGPLPGIRALVPLMPSGSSIVTIGSAAAVTPHYTASEWAVRGQAQLDANPLGILGRPDDVAPLIVFLISDEVRYISGTEIVVDGGFTSQASVKFLSDAVRGVASANPRS